MRTPQSEAAARGLLGALAKGYEEAEHPRGAAGRWAPRGEAGEALAEVADLEEGARLVAGLRAEVDAIADEEAEDMRAQVADHRRRVPTDYQALGGRQDDRRRRGYLALSRAVSMLRGVRVASPEDAETVARARRYAEAESDLGAVRGQTEAMWDEDFRAVLLGAESVLSGAAEAARRDALRLKV